jgi:hypothetical protein
MAMPGIYQTPSKSTSINLLSNDTTPSFNEFQDKVDKIVVRNKFKSVMQITLDLGFEVLTAVVMKSATFWDITLCSKLEVNRHFRGTYRLHLRGRISQARNELGLFFDPEDADDVFLRNVG